MNLRYKIDSPKNFSEKEKFEFIELLIKQGQVENPNMEKLNSCIFLCMVFNENIPIGIGAIKNIYNKPFEYAGVSDLKKLFKHELGYLYVESNSEYSFRGLGIGKNIAQYLLKKIENENVFATTEINLSNSMLFLLRKLGFESIGIPYIGKNTSKIISLMVLNRKK